MQRAPVDARHSSIRPPSRASCPEWALRTRASACSSLSRVTDEPPCAKRPLRGTGELRCSHFSPPCKRVVHRHTFLIVPAGSSAVGVDDSWTSFLWHNCLWSFLGKMAAFITSWRTWRFSAVVSFSCGFRFPSLSSTDEVESSTLGQSGVDSVPFIQSQQR